MFLSETLSRTIHADRVRDLERAAREHRLMAVEAEPAEPKAGTARIDAGSAGRRAACGPSANVPA